MKKFIKKLSLISLATIGAISVASCGNSNDNGSDTGADTTSGSSTTTSSTTTEDTYHDVDHKSVDNGTVTVAVQNDAQRYSYSNASYSERTKILGLLEKYAVENNITGLTLYGNGTFVGYSDRISSPTDWNYISGYGFGVLSEGNITADMEKENNSNWKRYYHTYETDKPATLNYMNDQGSVVGDLASYVQGSYFGTRIDEEDSSKYRWMGDLAQDDLNGFGTGLIQPVDSNDDNMATEFKFKLKNTVKYTTLSSNSTFAKYNNTSAVADDYITPYKLYFSQYISFVRAKDTFGTSSEFVGAQDYYNATKDAKTWADMDAAWDATMKDTLWVDSEGYMHIKYKQAHTLFYAMYECSNFMFAPVPKAFLSDLQSVGSYDNVADAAKGAWMNVTDNTHGSLTPVDTCLSSGAYAVEQWSDTALVFKRSNRDDLGEGMYNIAGIHFAILTSAKTDEEAAYKEFQSGTLDAAGVPSTMLAEERSKSYVHQTSDSTTYKINYNTCDAERWEELFGTNGTITQTSQDSYWDLKPAMANNDFVKALSYSLDRKTIAETYGVTASNNYFGNGYYSNPETGEIYNTTKEHKDAVASLNPEGTDEYGYSLTLAQEYFTKAAKTLTAAGDYNSGDTVKIEIAWQTQSQVDRYGQTLKSMFENAFNTSDAHNQYGLTLEISNFACAVWSDVYYKKMMVGQFDLAFGSISGNALNPLNFLEVLKSDNSSGFTLNWGPDTNAVDETMVYDGQAWSFDALWQAADSSCLVYNGAKAEYVDSALESSKYNSNGTRTTKIKYAEYTGSKYRAVVKGAQVSVYDQKGKTIEISDDDYTVTVADGYITVETKAGIEVGSCLMEVEVYYDVEVLDADGTWSVVDANQVSSSNSYAIVTGEAVKD